MTIPDKPLELSLDVNRLTLDEAPLFDPEEIGSPSTINRLRKFLLNHSASWTKEEIGAIEFGELAQVAEQITRAFQALSVPLSSSTPSKTGRASKAKRVRQPG